MELWTALVVGFFGSFHCIGMCGPIALALPGGNDSWLALFTTRFLYNFGRIVTYSALGALFGIAGYTLALSGFQKVLSVILGVSVIAVVLIKSSFFISIREKIGLEHLFNRLQRVISSQFKKRGFSTMFTIGLLNGLLPCGFVYVGLAGSLTTGTITEGALYMALFGAGTFPAMFLMSVAPNFIGLNMRRRINRFLPVLSILFGLYLIYRGLMMGAHGNIM